MVVSKKECSWGLIKAWNDNRLRRDMSKQKIAVLGASGMLGSMVLKVFAQSEKYDVASSFYKASEEKSIKKQFPEVKTFQLDVSEASVDDLKKVLKSFDWVINCIGLIKPYIHDDNADETVRAIKINSLFPDNLGRAGLKNKFKVIQIETDCVYSGKTGLYNEKDEFDPTDVYGKTKSLGETHLSNVIHLRDSIIGPEPSAHVSLLDWFLTQPENAEVKGYTNHKWNGITTYHFAKICQGIIDKDLELPRLQHVLPADILSKANLLKCVAKSFNRKDITIIPVKADKIVSRTLSTLDQKANLKIWQAVGYKTVPTLAQMVQELADYVNGGSK